MNEHTARALAILRDGSQFEWYLIPMFSLVVYVYAVEIERKNWNLVFAGLAFWGMDWINELINAAVFHGTGAPVWAAPGESAYLLLIGLNAEICFMFAIAGIVFGKILPQQQTQTIWGVPNRLFIACAGSVFCVIVELWLNRIDALTWAYSWWNASVPYLIFLLGYLPFFVVAFRVHDMKETRQQAMTVGIIYGVVIVAAVVLGSLGWL